MLYYSKSFISDFLQLTLKFPGNNFGYTLLFCYHFYGDYLEMLERVWS